MSDRIYQCSATQEIRDRLGLQYLEHAPRSCMLWGLFEKPPAAESYARALDEIEILELPSASSHNDDPVFIFTDGSCSQPGPNMKSERHAAYSVWQAQKDSHVGNLISSGVLPGRKQSPFRAEFFFAFMVAMAASLNSVVFTDCRAVWIGITRLQREGWNELFWLRSADSDLWRSAWKILQHPDRKLKAEWLESHRHIGQVRGAMDAWKIFHNGQAYRHAGFLANPLPHHIKQIHNDLISQNRNLERRRQDVTTLLKEIWNAHTGKD